MKNKKIYIFTDNDEGGKEVYRGTVKGFIKAGHCGEEFMNEIFMYSHKRKIELCENLCYTVTEITNK